MDRIRDIVSDLRAFANPATETERKLFSLKEALKTALRLVSHELEDLSVITDTGTDCRVFGSKTQITHVLMNLLVNSSKALNKIPSKRFPEIRISTGKENGRLKVKVWDNGVGVKQEDIPRVFEPFFTSRDVGEGIGLGLSICHTIVKNHGGTITLKSTEGEWTEVAFDLPVADQEG